MAAYENKQHWLNERDNKFKLRILGPEGKVVQSILPDEFGATVGSEYSTPFDTASVSERTAQVLALGGIAQKQGIRMQKMYTNAEPTEISFQMEFNAYYSPIDEVVNPIVVLTQMALGSIVTWNEANADLRALIEKISALGGDAAAMLGVNAQEEAQKANETIKEAEQEHKEIGKKLMDLIGVIESPEYVTVKFGNLMEWRRCYITSVGFRFSNVVDSQGFPLSAKADVTVTPWRYPVTQTMQSVFGLEKWNKDT